MQLEDRFYTSTEVAEILGVSLRSVYRYLEDGKLKAEVKTATGRHRFTREDINNFLYPDGRKQGIFSDSEEDDLKPDSSSKAKINVHVAPEIKDTKVDEEKSKIEDEEETVDWLAKFREAANKYREDQSTQMQQPQMQSQQLPQQEQQQVQQQTVQPQTPSQYQQPYEQIQYQQVQQAQPQPTQQQAAVPTLMYYRSMLGGLKDIAQNLDKSARNSNLDYAFTLNAGASLHKPIKPFATLHAYVRSTDRDFFEKILRLTSANQSNAQLCLVLSDNQGLYDSKEEVHGLYVVSKNQLKNDINTFGDQALMQEMADVIG